MIAQILTNSAAIKYNHYRRKNDRALNTEWSEKRKQANRPMNENYVDAEAGVIKSQKQPLLLTPWTNLSSVGYAFRCVVGPRRSSPHTTGQYGHQWWFSSLGPPPYSQATPSLPTTRHCSRLFGDLWILLVVHHLLLFHVLSINPLFLRVSSLLVLPWSYTDTFSCLLDLELNSANIEDTNLSR